MAIAKSLLGLLFLRHGYISTSALDIDFGRWLKGQSQRVLTNRMAIQPILVKVIARPQAIFKRWEDAASYK